MHKRLPALLLGCLLTAGAATAAPRAPRTLVVSAPQAVADSVLAPRISYEHPVTKTIAEVKITGSTSYDDFVLANLSGLNVGDEIQIPGAALTSAVNRYLQAGYFSNARILVTKYVGNKVYLEIQLTERPMRSTSRASPRATVRSWRSAPAYARVYRSPPTCSTAPASSSRNTTTRRATATCAWT